MSLAEPTNQSCKRVETQSTMLRSFHDGKTSIEKCSFNNWPESVGQTWTFAGCYRTSFPRGKRRPATISPPGNLLCPPIAFGFVPWRRNGSLHTRSSSPFVSPPGTKLQWIGVKKWKKIIQSVELARTNPLSREKSHVIQSKSWRSSFCFRKHYKCYESKMRIKKEPMYKTPLNAVTHLPANESIENLCNFNAIVRIPLTFLFHLKITGENVLTYTQRIIIQHISLLKKFGSNVFLACFEWDAAWSNEWCKDVLWC